MSTDSNVFHRFFAKCPDMLLLAGIDGAVRHSNEAMDRALGLEAKEGTRVVELVHPEDRGTFEAAWARLTAFAEPMRFDLRLRAAGGSYRALSCNMNVEAEQGEVYMGFHDARIPGWREAPPGGGRDARGGAPGGARRSGARAGAHRRQPPHHGVVL